MRWRCVPLLIVMACSSGSRTTTPGKMRVAIGDAGPTDAVTLSGPERMIDGRYYVRAGAPDPLACTNDRDCIGDTVTDDTGCCVRTSDAFPQTWTWHAWITQRRLSQDCDRVTCPPLPPGRMPSMCSLDVRCSSGRCADGCSQKPDDKQDAGQQQAPEKK